MTKQLQRLPERVFGLCKALRTPDGEVRALWEWLEVSVWTSCMLEELGNGDRASKWHRLIDKV